MFSRWTSLYLLIFGAIFLGGCYFYINYQRQILISPVLGIAKNRIGDNVWFPKEPTQSGEIKDGPKNLTAKAAFFVDAQTGQMLFEKNALEKMHVASLVKIMTTIVALENRSLGDKLRVSKRAAEMEPDKMFLIAGEHLSLKELLDGMFLVSANDAAEVLAEEVTGRREEFINLMNSKAKQLGMADTTFINPTGLEEDGREQYSTALDVLLMSRYLVYKYPEIVQISSQPHILIPQTENHQDYDLYSGINLVTSYPGVLGLKTGFTPEAGLTLVTLAKRGDKEVLGVILGATDRRDDARALLDYSFKKLGVKI